MWEPWGRTCTVLVVDDDAATTSAFARLLRGRRVLTAGTADEGALLAREQPPELAILDLFLGGHTSLGLVRALRASQPDLAIVVMTGFGCVDTAVDAMHAGATTVVCKPCGMSDILRKLARVGAPGPEIPAMPTLATVEDEYMRRVLVASSFNVSRSAKTLGLRRTSLQRRLRKLGVPPPPLTLARLQCCTATAQRAKMSGDYRGRTER